MEEIQQFSFCSCVLLGEIYIDAVFIEFITFLG